MWFPIGNPLQCWINVNPKMHGWGATELQRLDMSGTLQTRVFTTESSALDILLNYYHAADESHLLAAPNKSRYHHAKVITGIPRLWATSQYSPSSMSSNVLIIRKPQCTLIIENRCTVIVNTSACRMTRIPATERLQLYRKEVWIRCPPDRLLDALG